MVDSLWSDRFWGRSLKPIAVATFLMIASIVLGLLGCASARAAEPAAASDQRPTRHFARREMLEQIFSQRKVQAPSLDGGVGWINTSGPIDFKDLHGKFVLLDFWTYCCINCMHIMPELKRLEHAFPNNLVVIGVHTAKFEAEHDSKNIAEAVQRYELEHPIVNDANQTIWTRYEVSSWPTLILIDPEGYVIYDHAGETKADTLLEFLKVAVPFYRNKEVAQRTSDSLRSRAQSCDANAAAISWQDCCRRSDRPTVYFRQQSQPDCRHRLGWKAACHDRPRPRRRRRWQLRHGRIQSAARHRARRQHTVRRRH